MKWMNILSPSQRDMKETNQDCHQTRPQGRSRDTKTPRSSSLATKMIQDRDGDGNFCHSLCSLILNILCYQKKWYSGHLRLNWGIWRSHPKADKTDVFPISWILCQWQHLSGWKRSFDFIKYKKTERFLWCLLVFLRVAWLQASRYVENCTRVFSILKLIEEGVKQPERSLSIAIICVSYKCNSWWSKYPPPLPKTMTNRLWLTWMMWPWWLKMPML